MKQLYNLCALCLLLTACSGNPQPSNPPETITKEVSDSSSKPNIKSGNAIYHWKTTFAPTPEELAHLRRHVVRRIYLRMFDVAVERDGHTNDLEVVPIATTRFAGAIPDDVEVVPTVYITLEALREMNRQEGDFAKLIVERLAAMASYNNCGLIREMHFDCDWTSSTEQSYFALCKAAKHQLDSVLLSTTIRLHQLAAKVPPVDYGVLMLYNTGSLKSPKTRNSILDIEDVRPYLRAGRYPLPLNYAYPVFGWGVKFRSNEFQKIVTHPEQEQVAAEETVCHERPTADEIIAVKTLVESTLGQPFSGNVLYHLDKNQLNHYTDEQLAEIYATR